MTINTMLLFHFVNRMQSLQRNPGKAPGIFSHKRSQKAQRKTGVLTKDCTDGHGLGCFLFGIDPCNPNQFAPTQDDDLRGFYGDDPLQPWTLQRWRQARAYRKGIIDVRGF